MDAFPKPGRMVTAEMQCAQLKQLRKVTDVLLALAHTSRQHKVRINGTHRDTNQVHGFPKHSGLMHGVSEAEITSLKCKVSPEPK